MNGEASGEVWLGDAADDVQHELWLTVLADNARLVLNGSVEVCEPAGGLVVFEAQQDAADAVRRLTEDGAPLLSVVLCDFAVHWHLRVATA